MVTRLPGITQIAYVYTSGLSPHIAFQAEAGVPIGIFAPLTPIDFDKSSAVCETETEFDNNNILETASLTFATTEELPTDEDLAFVVTLASGERWLLGSAELPVPVIKTERTSGLPDGDTHVTKYTISCTNNHAIVQLSR